MRISLIQAFLFLALASQPRAEVSTGLDWNHLLIEAEPTSDGTAAEAWFTFTNNTDSPVEILEVKSDCECVVAQLDQHIHYPGETGLLLARVDLKPDSVPLEKTILVRFRSGQKEPETISLTIRVSAHQDGSQGRGSAPSREP